MSVDLVTGNIVTPSSIDNNNIHTLRKTRVSGYFQRRPIVQPRMWKKKRKQVCVDFPW